MRFLVASSLLLLPASLVIAQSDTQTYPAGAFPFPQPAQPGPVSQTTFDPAIQNIGGSTNSAGTFNVLTIPGTSSHAFESVQQTSTFVAGSASFASANPAATYSTGGASSVPQLNAQSNLFTSTGAASAGATSTSSPGRNAAMGTLRPNNAQFAAAGAASLAAFLGGFYMLA